MSKPEKLYIVFSPGGSTAPVKTHPTHKEAASAAWAMAKQFPGQTFYIMQKSGRPAFVEPAATAPEAVQEIAA